MSRTAFAPALLAAVLLLPLSACGGGEPSTLPPAATTSTTPSPTSTGVRLGMGTAPGPAAAAVDETFTISVGEGRASGDTGRLKIPVGDSVSITVTSLRADEVHLHGYDLSAPVRAGLTAVLTFDATLPGVFALELEDAGTELATLQVQ